MAVAWLKRVYSGSRFSFIIVSSFTRYWKLPAVCINESGVKTNHQWQARALINIARSKWIELSWEPSQPLSPWQHGASFVSLLQECFVCRCQHGEMVWISQIWLPTRAIFFQWPLSLIVCTAAWTLVFRWACSLFVLCVHSRLDYVFFTS